MWSWIFIFWLDDLGIFGILRYIEIFFVNVFLSRSLCGLGFDEEVNRIIIFCFWYVLYRELKYINYSKKIFFLFFIYMDYDGYMNNIIMILYCYLENGILFEYLKIVRVL